MPPHYSKLAEHDIRLIVIEPKIEGEPTVRCTLKHLSLKETVRNPDLISSRERIPFEGLETTVCAEYLHVHANAKKKGLRARGLSRLKRALGGSRTKSEDIDPLDQPDEYDFTISVGRPRVVGGDPTPQPEELPQSWKNRYQWGDYVALSYHWGDPKDTVEIIIYDEGDHQATNRTGVRHPVTRNLHAALSQLRERGIFAGTLMLWIDALCIDQGNADERVQQCAHMDKIYRQAGNVLVWLGPEKDYGENPQDGDNIHVAPETAVSSDHAISYLQWLSAYYRTEILEYLDQSRDILQATQFREYANFRLKNSLRMVTSNIKEDFHYIDIDEYGWLSVLHFFDNPYWKRLWIIQELIMGTERTVVVCGNRFTQWRHIRDGALIIAAVYNFVTNKIRKFAESKGLKMPHIANRAVEHVAGIAELSIHANRKILPFVDPRALSYHSKPGPKELPTIQGTGLMQLLSLASQAHCYRPGDRVLGMLYVPPLRWKDGLTVTPATTLQDLYSTFARHLMLSGKVPEELGFVPNDEVAGWTEITTVSMDGRITETAKIQKYAYNGVGTSLDHLSILDGFVDELMLPSWVPNLAMPEWRKTHPFLGPWHASGLGQGVPLPRIESIRVPGTTALAAGIVLRGVQVDIVAGLGAIQSLQEQKMVTKEVKDGEPMLKTMPYDIELPDGIQSVYQNPLFFQRGLVQASPRTSSPPETEVETALYRVLTGNTDMHGKVIDASCLLSEIPSQNWNTSIEVWNWDFINSSKDLRIGEETLGKYFSCTNNIPGGTLPGTIGQAADPDAIDAAMSSMAAKTKGRRLLLTSAHGFIGLGPMAMRPGDVVAILIGHNRPMVIRQNANFGGQQIWRMVGECFVQGLMEFLSVRVLKAASFVLPWTQCSSTHRYQIESGFSESNAVDYPGTTTYLQARLHYLLRSLQQNLLCE